MVEKCAKPTTKKNIEIFKCCVCYEKIYILKDVFTTIMHVRIDDVEEVIVRKVKCYGSNGVVNVPKRFENKIVKVIVINDDVPTDN